MDAMEKYLSARVVSQAHDSSWCEDVSARQSSSRAMKVSDHSAISQTQCGTSERSL